MAVECACDHERIDFLAVNRTSDLAGSQPISIWCVCETIMILFVGIDGHDLDYIHKLWDLINKPFGSLIRPVFTNFQEEKDFFFIKIANFIRLIKFILF